MHINEIRKMNYEDLVRELDSSYHELFNLRFQLSTKQATNFRELRRVRRKIARIKTVLREMELSGSHKV